MSEDDTNILVLVVSVAALAFSLGALVVKISG